jgi:hypothetical protein
MRLGLILVPFVAGGALFALWYFQEPLMYALKLKKEQPVVKPVVVSVQML